MFQRPIESGWVGGFWRHPWYSYGEQTAISGFIQVGQVYLPSQTAKASEERLYPIKEPIKE